MLPMLGLLTFWYLSDMANQRILQQQNQVTTSGAE